MNEEQQRQESLRKLLPPYKMTRLKLERLKRRIKQYELARSLGMDERTLSAYENGRYNIDSDNKHAKSLHAYFGMSGAELKEVVDRPILPTRHRKTYDDSPHRLREPCALCGTAQETHAKCRVCDALIHPANDKYLCTCGVQHAIATNKNLCKYCTENVDYLDRKIVSML